MKIETYFIIGIAMLIVWLSVIFFAYGGLAKPKLFFRLCRMKGKWRFIWTIVAVAALLVSIYGFWLYGLSREYISLLLLATYLGAVTITDLRSREIPDDATLFFAVLFLLWTATAWDLELMMDSILGAIVGAGIPFLIYFMRSDAIGLGDIKLLACVGLLAGVPGILFMLLRAMVFGAIYSIGLLILHKGTLKTELPFAPFMLVAALI